MKKGYRILSIEARDIYGHEQQYGRDVGYLLLSKDDESYFEQFRNKLDESLDTDELKRVYEGICGAPFSFSDSYGNVYTQAVVSVKFNAGYGKNVKILALREYFYEHGFCIDGNRYVRYKRSAGSSRTGKCLFIDERLYETMSRWSECGLSAAGDPASWEAYKSLSLSSIKGQVDIPIEGILFIEDYKCGFTDEVVSVELNGGELVAQTKEEEIENNIWDGESLLDESVFTGEYGERHMLLLRNKFFKSCAFRTKLQKWIKDRKITLEELRARGFVTLAEDISQIVMVTTESSLKYLKFAGTLSGETVRKWAACVSSSFGVVKWDKRTRYFGGRMVSSSYQLLNTLGLSAEQAEKKLQPSKDYLTTIWQDVDFMRYHFTDVCKREDDGEEDDWSDGGNLQSNTAGETAEGLAQRAEILFELLGSNHDFEYTDLYKEFRLDVRQDQERKMERGRILLPGTNATLFGNGPELLKYIAGEKVESTLKPGEIWCKRFGDGQKLLCARSPHITMGNLYCVVNRHEGEIWDYFDLGENIVCVNAIGENIQQKLNGCDYDSDTMLITCDELLIETAEKYERLFKVPFCKIESSRTATHTLARLDYLTSMNMIGDIVNLSQKLNSIIWDKLNNGDDNTQDIYSDVCKLAVLSGLEIDKAKRAYDDIDVRAELERIRKKYDRPAPMFFKPIYCKIRERWNKGGTKSKDKEYSFHDTTMEYFYSSASKINYQKGKKKYSKHVRISDMLHFTPTENPADNAAVKKVIEELEKYGKRVNWLRMQLQKADEDEKDFWYDKLREVKKERDAKIAGLLTNENVLVLTLIHYENLGTKNTNFYDPLLCSKTFGGILKKSKEKLNSVKESPTGEYTLYDFRFTKE